MAVWINAVKPLLASLAIVCCAASQSLPPETQLLVRIKSHMSNELSNLPNYTCLETISRFQKLPGAKSASGTELKPLDTVRLEIVYSNQREWYGWPGDKQLSADSPGALVGGGMIGTGAFAVTLHNILGASTITYSGEETIGGRAAVRYNFHLPALRRLLVISLGGHKGAAGQDGSFWVDPQSLDLIRLDSHAIEIPPNLPLKDASTNVDYARTRIGARDVLLAQRAEMHMTQSTGEESYDQLEFTHCHAYSVESSIRFDQESQQPARAPAVNAPPPADLAEASRAIPALLPITVQLTGPITDRDSVGTLVDARVAGDVRNRGKVLISDGAAVRGRIRRLERYQQPGRGFLVSLEFTEVETSNGPLRFYADLVSMDERPEMRPSLSESVLVSDGRLPDVAGQTTVTLPELPSVVSFVVTGSSFTLPSGFRTVWRTRDSRRKK